MNFLIVYATTEGQTRKIADFVSDRIRVHKHDVVLVDATDHAVGDLKLRDYDGVILAASLHVGRFQSAIEDFALKGRRDTPNPPKRAAPSFGKTFVNDSPVEPIGGPAQQCSRGAKSKIP